MAFLMNTRTKIHLVLYFLFICIPSLTYSSELIGQKGLIVTFFYLAFFLSFTLLPLVILRPYYWGIILIPFLFIVPAELIHVLHYDGFSTISAVASSVETNREEMSEFLHNYRLYFYVCIPIAIILTISHFVHVRPSHSLSKRIKLIAGVSFLLVIGAFTVKVSYDNWSIRHKTGDVYNGLLGLYHRLFTQNYPYAYLPKIYDYVVERIRFDQAIKLKRNYIFGAKTDPATLKKSQPLVVVVIGESSRAHNWSLGGYKRITNPLLSKRKDIYYCKDATSSATQTRESVELALTRASPHNLSPAYKEKSIVSAYKEAGYSTVWISNQKMTGGVDTAVYAIAKEASETHFVGNDYRYQNSYDEKMLPVLSNVLKKHKNQATLLVMHTIGSHEVYRMRYPPSFEIFEPASKGDDYNWNSPGIRERLLNSYDNSILYTDYILNKIILQLEAQKRDVSLLFFSDHGENVLDDGTSRFGHGGVLPTKYVIHIPMFFWFSKKYNMDYAQKVKHTKINCNSPVSENYVFDTILELGNIKINGYEANQSIASNNMIFKPERFILNAALKPILNTSVK